MTKKSHLHGALAPVHATAPESLGLLPFVHLPTYPVYRKQNKIKLN